MAGVEEDPCGGQEGQAHQLGMGDHQQEGEDQPHQQQHHQRWEMLIPQRPGVDVHGVPMNAQ